MKPITSAAITALIVSAVFYFLVPRTGGGGGASASGSSAGGSYERIRANGTIRAAYAPGAPLFIVDPNTKQKSGIFHDLVERAAAKLDLKVDWAEEVAYGDMIEGLNTRRYDLVGSGIWINAARGKEADFTIPAYYDAVLAYVREGDTRFDKDLSILNSPSYTIATMDGELGATIAKTDFPKAKAEALPQTADFAQMVLNVIDKKADVVFLSLARARAYQVQNPNKIRAAGKPVRVFPVSVILAKGELDLKRSLDYALGEMFANGEVETILSKYEKVPGSHLRAALPYQPGEALK